MHTSDPTAPQPNGQLTIGLISNPYSGRNRKLLDGIGRIVADYPNVHHRLTRNIGEIPSVLEEFANLPVDLLAINGGDGTIAAILTELLEQPPFDTLPWIALLPGGSTNMNAGDVGLRGNLTKAIRRLCKWSTGGIGAVETLTRPVLRVTGGDGQAAVCGMAFGVGIVIQGIEYFHNKIDTRGFGSQLGPVIAMLRTFWGIARHDRRFLQPVAISVQRNDEPSEQTRDILFLVVSGLERMFLGLRPCWGRQDAPLHVTLLYKDADRVLRNLPSLLRGKPNRHMTETTGYSSYNVERIRVYIDGMWALDGELYHASVSDGPVTISNGANVTFVRL